MGKKRLTLTGYPLIALPLLGPRRQNTSPLARVDDAAILVIERGSRVAPTNSTLAVTELANDAAGGPWAVGCKGKWAVTSIPRKDVVLEGCCGNRGTKSKCVYDS